MDDGENFGRRKVTRSFSVVNWKPSDTQGNSGSSWKFWRRLSIRSRGHASGRSKVSKNHSEPGGVITKADIGEPSLDIGLGPQSLPDVVVEGSHRLPVFNANAIPPPKPPRLFLSKTPSNAGSRSSSAESIPGVETKHSNNNNNHSPQHWHLLDSDDFTRETREALGHIASSFHGADDDTTATTLRARHSASRYAPGISSSSSSQLPTLSSSSSSSSSSLTPAIYVSGEEDDGTLRRREGDTDGNNRLAGDSSRPVYGVGENNSSVEKSSTSRNTKMGNSVVPLCLINDDTSNPNPVVTDDIEEKGNKATNDNDTIHSGLDYNKGGDNQTRSTPPSPPTSQPPPRPSNVTSLLTSSPPKTRHTSGGKHIYTQYHQNGYGTVPRKPKIVTPELSQKRYRRPRSRKLSSCDDQVSRQWRIMTSVLDLMCQRLDPYPLLDPLKRAGVLTNLQLQSFLGHCDRRSICEGLVDIIGKGTPKCLSVFSAAVAACPGNCTEILEILQAMREIDRLVYDMPEQKRTGSAPSSSLTPAASAAITTTTAMTTTASSSSPSPSSSSTMAEDKILNFDIGYLSTDYNLKPLVELERARSNSGGGGGGGGYRMGSRTSSYSLFDTSMGSTCTLEKAGYGGQGMDPAMFSGLVMMSVTINGHNLAGGRCQALVDVVRGHNCISELHLGKTCLSGQEVTSLTEALSADNSSTCHTLDLRLNPVDALGAEGICQLLRQTRFLRVLNLSSTELDSRSFQEIVAAISGNKSLVEFDGSFLDISDECCLGLRDMLRVNTSLQKLRLRGNNVSPVGCETLCKGLAKNISLGVLDLSRNPIGDVGAQALASYLPDSSVTEVYIDGCGMTSGGGTALAEMVSGCKRLRHLDVSTNDLQDAGAKRVAAALERTSSLMTVSLNMCSITNDGFSKVLDAMERNTSIHRLKLCYNKIGGDQHSTNPSATLDNLRYRLRIVLSSNPKLKIILWGNSIEDSA